MWSKQVTATVSFAVSRRENKQGDGIGVGGGRMVREELLCGSL